MNNESNPFKAPEARVADVFPEGKSEFIPGGRRVPAGNGVRWLGKGWELFREAPGTWIGLCIVLLIILSVLSYIPGVSLSINLLMPLLMGGVMVGCKAQEDGGEVQVGHLFAGFSSHTGHLLQIGAIYMAGVIAVMGIASLAGGGFDFLIMMAGGEAEPESFEEWTLSLLVLMGLSIPLFMAIWYAPHLVMFHESTPLQAMKVSFFACLKNFVPFVVYGLATLLLAIVASIPLFLGWLALFPVVYASVYTSYRDIFTQEQ